MESAALFIVALVALLFAVLTFLQRTLYASTICFLVVLLQVAALFYLFGAPVLAFLQILIYAGAVMVLATAAIMVSPLRIRERWARIFLPPWVLAAALLLPLLELFFLPSLHSGGSVPAPWPSLISDFGAALFGRFAPLTETVGILIFLAALAVVEIGRPES